jgi:hypothetical protein
MAQKAEYQAIQVTTMAQLAGQLNQLAQNGWKPILMTTTYASVTPGAGNIVTTVIMEHVLGT